MPTLKPSSHRNVTAVLGPTNTGKTHLAVERMLGHGGGMIGFPLRLLAREVYDKVRAKVGDHAVALMTGEEKIIPVKPRYWIATVEAMPPDVSVPFLAIDEVQLAQDFERGHIFTDRILHRRGTDETMFLGAATMRPILEKLLPGINIVSRPRFSKLLYAGQKKLTRLPRRSAIVAFSADMVYAVAELVRRHQGGAAVVMGSLSPRTRNAQVALYQSGDVDYLVATDAIGMGLNMDVDHVAFAATRKFDGFQFRNLNPAELGQIAGRAGRYMNDGTFGVTADSDPFDQETVERLEGHHFENARVLQWRNRELDFRSLDLLRKSLGTLPTVEGLTRAQSASDVLALEALYRDPATADLIGDRDTVMRAWEVCQIPDYRNISPAEHAYLVNKVITFLHTGRKFIPEDWFAKQLSHCENLDGGIDALSTRISHVRTWTFIANRADWLEAPLFWQSRAKEIEDRLSDVLHERLTQRFIDRRTSVLMRRLAKKEGLMTSVEDDGAIHVEGEFVGRISGLSFTPDTNVASQDSRTLKTAAVQALSVELGARAKALTMTADTELKLSRDGFVTWQGQSVGRLAAGDNRFNPRVEVMADETLEHILREQVGERLQKFVTRYIASQIEPLMKLEAAESLEGMARGLAYRLSENYGVLPRDSVAEEVKGLSQEDRAKLRVHGVRFGAFTVFLPALLKAHPTDLRILLWWLEKQKDASVTVDMPTPPANGLTSALADAAKPEGFYQVCGYRICGPRAVRVDMLERLADMVRDRVFWKAKLPEEQRPMGSVEGGGFTVFPDLMSLVGCSGAEFEQILVSLGFKSQVRSVVKQKPVEVLVEAAAASVEAVEVVPDVAVEEVVQEAVKDQGEVVVSESHSETVAEPVERVDVTVWWPKDTGPFRAEHKKPAFKRPEKKHDEAGNSSGNGEDRKPRFNKNREKFKREAPVKFEKPAPKEKPMDPNSPFAALAALKAQMKGN